MNLFVGYMFGISSINKVQKIGGKPNRLKQIVGFVLIILGILFIAQAASYMYYGQSTTFELGVVFFVIGIFLLCTSSGTPIQISKVVRPYDGEYEVLYSGYHIMKESMSNSEDKLVVRVAISFSPYKATVAESTESKTYLFEILKQKIFTMLQSDPRIIKSNSIKETIVSFEMTSEELTDDEIIQRFPIV